MLQLMLIRHGETEKNRLGVFCGWNDGMLTDKGISEAEIVAEKLKHEKIDKMICSDLNRTVETAAIINRNHKAPKVLMESFREMNFGSWEGLTYHEITDKYPQEVKAWEQDWIDYAVPGGESLRQMYHRVTVAIDQLIDQYNRGNIVIVSHSGCIRGILSHLIGRGIEDYWKYKVDHCGVIKIEIMDGFAVLTGLNQ